jgi:hypothetical protein
MKEQGRSNNAMRFSYSVRNIASSSANGVPLSQPSPSGWVTEAK